MNTHCIGGLRITPNREGSRQYAKVSYPIRYGRYAEILARRFAYQFNLNGEIKFLQGRHEGWPHPAEWLKRTTGNDWVYYASGEYRELFGLIGEYYVPCLSYPSNACMGGRPFENPLVGAGIESLDTLHRELCQLDTRKLPQDVKMLVARIKASDARALQRGAARLHDQLGSVLTVLPPDTRHVDYDVLPIVVADGCAYNCAFCRVKSGLAFRPRDRRDIRRQIEGIRGVFRHDLYNYSSVFLADHDALRAGQEILEFAAREAYERFELAHSYLTGACLFLFGSADTMVFAEEGLFEMLNRLPYTTYLNIGLESPDPATLKALGKPLTPEAVERAFARLLEVNRRYEKIEVSANFVLGNQLPPSHLSSVIALTAQGPERTYVKGAAYLSPLVWGSCPEGDERKRLLGQFREVKVESRLPVYLYLIQRL